MKTLFTIASYILVLVIAIFTAKIAFPNHYRKGREKIKEAKEKGVIYLQNFKKRDQNQEAVS